MGKLGGTLGSSCHHPTAWTSTSRSTEAQKPKPQTLNPKPETPSPSFADSARACGPARQRGERAAPACAADEPLGDRGPSFFRDEICLKGFTGF